MATNLQSQSNGTIAYSVPNETRTVFENGLLQNPLIVKYLPKNFTEYAKNIEFYGNALPVIPINWRFAESVASLKGLEAVYIQAILHKKYQKKVEAIKVNTDHAQLFFMSTLLWTIDPEGNAVQSLGGSGADPNKVFEYFPNYDHGRLQGSLHRMACTNIYETQDGRYFHLHGSMNPDISLNSIGLPYDKDASSFEESWQPFVKKIGKIEAQDMQRIASDEFKQAGTICWTTEEYRSSEHGKANSHTGLFEIREHTNSGQKPCWWPNAAHTSASRPLAGLKVVDITRVIAAPAITRGLAELGASVMRVTAPHLNDYSSLHCDMNWGKWNCALDFRNEEDREKLKRLIWDADVVVTAYRPHVLDKWGFGETDILKICESRDRGIIYARENCYGWNGEWSYRSGWQQISDANCGVSMEFGRAMGNDEPVTPVFPNSDYCTGISGVCGILQALLLRAEQGGSYSVDTALNYYSQWLVNSVGIYPEQLWQSLWQQHGKPVFRHYHNMLYTIPRMMDMLNKHGKEIIFRDEFFENRPAPNLKTTIRTVKPVLQFPSGEVELKYNVGTRTNGIDQPKWPDNLLTEVVN